MKLKKITSFIVAVALIAGTMGTNVMAESSASEPVNYSDYVPGRVHIDRHYNLGIRCAIEGV